MLEVMEIYRGKWIGYLVYNLINIHGKQKSSFRAFIKSDGKN